MIVAVFLIVGTVASSRFEIPGQKEAELQKRITRLENNIQKYENKLKDESDDDAEYTLGVIRAHKRQLDRTKKLKQQFEHKRQMHLIRETALQRPHERVTAIRELDQAIEHKRKMLTLQERYNELMKAVTERQVCKHTLELDGFEKKIVDEVKSHIAAVRKCKRRISEKTKQVEQLELECTTDLQKLSEKDNLPESKWDEAAKLYKIKWNEYRAQKNLLIQLCNKLERKKRIIGKHDERVQKEIEILEKFVAEFATS